MKKFTPLVVLIFGLMLVGCSEVQDDKNPAQGNLSVHGVGFANAASEQSHQKLLQNNGWNTQTCKSCHGFAYDGGTAGQTCLTCHSKPNGPEYCGTCHASDVEVQWKDLLGNTNSTIRTVGAHQKHVTQGTLGADVACSTCHAVPSTVAATGHLGSDSKAEVRFDTTLSMYRSNAIYNASNVSCANTYCHGNFNGGNLNRTMTWTDTSSTAVACGTCHGDATKSTTKEKAFPVSGHTFVSVTADCSSCHGAVVNASMAIINPSKHINGKID